MIGDGGISGTILWERDRKSACNRTGILPIDVVVWLL